MPDANIKTRIPMSLPDCDMEVYQFGTPVYIIHEGTALQADYWVKLLAIGTGQKMDWHDFDGNKRLVKVVGDATLVRNYIKNAASYRLPGVVVEDFIRG